MMENRESRDLKSLPLDLLKEKMTELSEKPFRAKQLYDWMHVKLAGDYDEMTNLSAALRNRLKEEYPLTTLRVVREQTSAIDGTKKFLFALPDGNLVESVWMQYKHGNSVCISSQVGCRMGLPLLRVYAGRSGTGTDACGNAGSDLPDSEADRGEGK